jgi:hypothetical protein
VYLFSKKVESLHVDPILLGLNSTLKIERRTNDDFICSIETHKFYDVLHKYSINSNTNYKLTINDKVAYDSHKPDIHAREVCLKFMEAIVNHYIEEKTSLKVVKSQINMNTNEPMIVRQDHTIIIGPKTNNNFNIEFIKAKFEWLVAGNFTSCEVSIVNYLDFDYNTILSILDVLQQAIV